MADPLETNFLVVPFTTALQRVAREDAITFVLVALGDGDYVDFKQLRSELAQWPQRQRGSVYFDVRHRLKRGQTIKWVDGEPSPKSVLFKQNELVRLAFEGLAREADFRGATVTACLP